MEFSLNAFIVGTHHAASRFTAVIPPRSNKIIILKMAVDQMFHYGFTSPVFQHLLCISSNELIIMNCVLDFGLFYKTAR